MVPGKDQGGGGPTLELAYGLDERGKAGAGLPRSATLGSSVKVTFDYDDQFNLQGADSSWGAGSHARYDEWDRPISSQSGGRLDEDANPTGGALEDHVCPDAWQDTGVKGGLLADRAYDAAGHLVRDRRCQDVVDPASGVLEARWVERFFTYNAREQLVKVEQTNLAAPGRLAEVDPALQTVLEIEYDDFGRVEAEHRSAGAAGEVVTHYGYDDAGRVAAIRLDDAATEQVGYDRAGRVSYHCDGDEARWFGAYDAWGRLYKEWLPTGAVVQRKLDEAGNVLSEMTCGGDCESSPVLAQRMAHYTVSGEPDLEVTWLRHHDDPSEPAEVRVTRRLFDTAGRTVEILSGPAAEAPGQPSFAVAPDPATARRDLVQVYEGNDERVAWRYFGGPAEGDVEQTAERAEHYDYLQPDGDGTPLPWPFEVQQLERVPGQPGLVPTVLTELQYDGQGRPVLVSSSDGSSIATLYDRLGGAIQTMTGEGTITRSAFDSAGRLLRQYRPSPRGSTAYAYTLDGRLLEEAVERAVDPASPENPVPGSYWETLWTTAYSYQVPGDPQPLTTAWVRAITHPDGSVERFDYNPDGSVRTHTTREALSVTYDYDPANRLLAAIPAGTPPATMAALDQGDHYQYDRLRLVKAGFDDGFTLSGTVAFPSFDLEGRPRSEVVGSREAMGFEYDAWGNRERVTLPSGVGRDPAESVLTGYQRAFDTLDRLSGVGALSGLPSAFGADWSWGGGRLYGVTTRGPLATATRFAYYGQPGAGVPSTPGATWRLARLSFGSAQGASDPTTLLENHTWGGLELGYRGTAEQQLDGAKEGRRSLGLGLGLDAAMGWSWGLDPGLRVATAYAGPGSLTPDDSSGALESFTLLYGEGDQLERLVTSTESVDFGPPQPAGRLWGRGSVPFSYDASGSRTGDDRFTYSWDWRGRLAVVTVADPESPYAGHQVRYDYDALGRLLKRLHLGPLPEGDTDDSHRPFIELRQYLWEGSALLAEAGYGSLDGSWDDDSHLFLRWRKSYVPGPALDDAVQVRVQIEQPADSPDPDTLYSYLRDELGTVIGLVREEEGGDPAHPPVLARYLYTPYGEAFAETGPDLVAASFDVGVTSVETSGGVVVQDVTDPAANSAGALRLSLSAAPDPATLASGLLLQDDTTGVQLTQGTDYAIGPVADHPEELLLLPLDGWVKAHEYSVGSDCDARRSRGAHPRTRAHHHPGPARERPCSRSVRGPAPAVRQRRRGLRRPGRKAPRGPEPPLPGPLDRSGHRTRVRTCTVVRRTERVVAESRTPPGRRQPQPVRIRRVGAAHGDRPDGA